MCKKIVETPEEKAIATICENCNTSENLNNFLKNLDYKLVKDIISAKEIQNIKEIYLNGKNKGIVINEYGEVL